MSDDDLSNKIKQEIIDLILRSPLNIPEIPDDLEREMYEAIFDIIEDAYTANRCAICKWVKSFFPTKKINKESQ